MRVLVTGASGMLGCTLASFLEKRGHSIIRHGRNDMTDVNCDLIHCSDTASMLKNVAPDCVVNLAAATNVDGCEQNPQNAYLLNIRAVENLVAGLAIIKDAFLIQISTDQVYDMFGDSDENNVRLSNVYSMSKYAGELAALRMSATVLRTNFFGNSLHPGRKSFSDWILENLRDGKEFTAFTDVTFSPLLMDTLSAAIDMVLRQPVSGIFNLGSNQGMSKADFAKALAQTFDLSVTSMWQGSSTDGDLLAYRPKNMCMNSSKFERTFDIKLPRLIDEIKRLRSPSNVAT